MDRLISEFDRALRAIVGAAPAARESPARERPEAELDATERAHAAALMRVNHVGEVCAQALSSPQALTARDRGAKAALEQASRGVVGYVVRTPTRIARSGITWPGAPGASASSTDARASEKLGGSLLPMI